MTKDEAMQWIHRRLEFEAWLSALRAAAPGAVDSSSRSAEVGDLATGAPDLCAAGFSSIPPEASLPRGSRPNVLTSEQGRQDATVRESANSVAASDDLGDVEASAPGAGEPVPHLDVRARRQRLQVW
jgi:hypothetical protein